jgi:hypothetical protein
MVRMGRRRVFLWVGEVVAVLTGGRRVMAGGKGESVSFPNPFVGSRANDDEIPAMYDQIQKLEKLYELLQSRNNPDLRPLQDCITDLQRRIKEKVREYGGIYRYMYTDPSGGWACKTFILRGANTLVSF